MTAIIQLEQMGYRFQLAIDYDGPENPPSRAGPLLEEIAARRDEAIAWLARRKEWQIVQPDEGKTHDAVFDAGDEQTMRRWADALKAGLISLDGKVEYHTEGNIVRLRYRTVLPHEWIEGD